MELTFRTVLLMCVIALLSAPQSLFAQLLAYEGFTGLSLGSGLSGSGTGALGWSDSGWGGGSDARYQIIDPLPNMTYQISGGAFLDGSTRAVQLTTAPEPVSGGLVASRTIPGQNTTLYVSFLIRPVSIGTGSDALDVRFNFGSTILGRVGLTPDQAQQYLRVDLSLDGGGIGAGGQYNGPLYLSQTYLVVARITWPTTTQINIGTWVNPPAVFPGGNGSQVLVRTIGSGSLLNTIGLGITSTDTGGPTTTIIIDELRIGYTWADVVLPGPPPALVPDVGITQAIKLRWQTQTGKIYQVQYSYDLTTWTNSGSSISGNGQIKEVFDSTESDASKFYRVQVQ